MIKRLTNRSTRLIALACAAAMTMSIPIMGIGAAAEENDQTITIEGERLQSLINGGENENKNLISPAIDRVNFVSPRIEENKETEEPTIEQVDEPLENPVDKPIDEPVDEPVDEPIEEITITPTLYNATASSGKCGKNLKWALDKSGVLTISGTGDMNNYSYNKNNKKSPWHENSAVVCVVIQDGVASIGNYAFYNCTNLTNITISDSVTSIGSGAFAYCASLTSVTIPDSVTGLGEGPFAYCTKLASVSIGNGVNGVNKYAFRDCASLKSITIPKNVTSFSNYAFYNCTNLKIVKYTGDIASWLKISFGRNGDYATNPLFYGASLYLNDEIATDIVIPDTVTKINNNTFSGCMSLTSITIPSSVTSIGGGAFERCTSLASVTIPDSVTSIGYDAFWRCTSLTKVYYNGTADKWSSISIERGNDDLTKYASIYHYCETEPSSKGYYWHYTDGLQTVWSMLPELSYSTNDDDKTCTITGIIINTEANLIIPDYIDCYKVCSISKNAFENNRSFASITISDSVTSIGDQAFGGCTSLKTVNYTGDIESWLKISFSNHYSNPLSNGASIYFNGKLVTDVVVPDTIKKISYAFSGCTSITSITIPDSVTSIDDGAFYGCTSLASITIPDSVTSIGSYAFYGCTSLTSISIPDSVTSIGNYAFYGCTSLASITISDELKSIEHNAFQGCLIEQLIFIDGTCGISAKLTQYFPDSINSVIIPDSVTSIGDGTFNSYTNLKTVYYTGDIESWLKKPSNFYNSNLLCNGASLYINDELVTNVIVPDTITKINNYAFYKWTWLTSITIPGSVTSIGNYAFYGCTSLTSITIGNSLTSIGEYAFLGCKSLASITIPDSVTSIGDYAFYGCTNLVSITIPSSVTSIGSGAFERCKSLASITIPDSVTSIGSGAFECCTSLASITIPDSVTSSGGSAFERCTSLASITIPESVTSIGNYAFEGCKNLKTVNYTGDIESWMKISFYSYSSNPCCYNGALPYFNGELVTDVVVPDAITKINSYAFYNCTGLTSITIPDSVTSISERAFEGCTNLTSIYILNPVTDISGRYDTIPSHTVIYGYVGSTAEIHAQFFGNKFIALDPENLIHSGEFGDGLTWELRTYDGELTISGSGAMPEYLPGEAPWSEYIDRIFTIKIDSGITSICSFKDCVNLISIRINGASTVIPDDAAAIANGAVIYGMADSTAKAYAEKFDRKFIELPHDHVYAETWTSDENSHWHACVICGDKKDVVAHTPGEAVISNKIEPTCTVAGNYDEIVSCTICGGLISNKTITIDAPGHDFGDEYKYDISGHYHECTVCSGKSATDVHEFVDDKCICGYYEASSGVISGITWSFDRESGVLVIGGDGAITGIDLPWGVFVDRIVKVELGGGITSINADIFEGCDNVIFVIININIVIGGSLGKTPTIIAPAGSPVYSYAKSNGISFIPSSGTGFCGSDGDNLYWSIENGKLTISGSGNMADFSGVSAPWADRIGQIKQIELGDGVTSIGGGAFAGCKNVIIIIISINLIILGGGDTIGSGATVIIPEGSAASDYVGKYAGVTVSGDRCGVCGDGLYWSFDSTSGKLTISGIGDMYDYSGKSAPWSGIIGQIKSIELGDSVTSIGVGAFAGCRNIIIIIINVNLIILGDGSTIGSGATIILPEGSAARDFADKYADRTFIDGLGGYCGADGGRNVIWSFDETTGRLTFIGVGEIDSVSIPWADKIGQIREIYIPRTITGFNADIFAGCANVVIVIMNVNIIIVGNANGFGDGVTIRSFGDSNGKRFADENALPFDEIKFIYGDANGDHMIDSKDIIMIKKYIANYDNQTGTSTVEVDSGADANGDGKIDSKDVILLKKYIANLDSSDNSTIILGKG